MGKALRRYSTMTRIFVGNLPDTATGMSVGELFAVHGKVERVALIIDQQTGKPRGFGFVEMPAPNAVRANRRRGLQ